jgi:Domain of unknown function (DUF5753)
VLPFAAGANAGMEGEFVILGFPGGDDPPVAYAEGLMGDIYLESEEELDRYNLESEEELDRYNLAWTHLVTEALSPADSITMIGKLSKESR